MKIHGVGVVLLFTSFLIGTYALFVPCFVSPPPQSGSLYTYIDQLNEFISALHNALWLGFFALVLADVGSILFLAEFVKHEHEVKSTKPPPPPTKF